MNAAGERLEAEDDVAAVLAPSIGFPMINPAHGHAPLHPPDARPCTTVAHVSTPVVLSPPTVHFLRAALLHSPLLSTLSSVDETDDLQYQLDRLINSTRRVTLPPGSLLVKQDEVGDEFFVIEQGIVDVVKTRHKCATTASRGRWSSRAEEDDEDAPSTMVASAGPGDLVGELSVFYHIPRQASLLTRTEVTAYAIGSSALNDFLAAHPHLSSALQQRRWLRAVLKQHYLFSHLDDESEKERLISAFHPRHYNEGEAIISQGDDADQFYILAQGQCQVSTISRETRTPVPVAVVHAGQSFGEVALLYATQRGATVTCQSSHCAVYSIHGRDFLAHCQRGSLFLQHVFYRFAHYADPLSNEKLMTREDFLAAIKFISRHTASSSPVALSDSRLRLMFRLADVSGDSVISFTEFLYLHILLSHPHTSTEVAFRLFDKDCNGLIDRDEFSRVIQWLLEDHHAKLHGVHYQQLIDKFFSHSQSLNLEQFQSLLQTRELQPLMSAIRSDLQEIERFIDRIDITLPLSTALLTDTSSLSLQSIDAIDDHLFRVLPWRTLLAGGIAGGLSRTLVSPLERLKILFQTQGQGMAYKYRGVLQSLQLIWKEDGVKGLFRGNGSNVIRIVPAVALQFAFYDVYKRVLFDLPVVPLTQEEKDKCRGELGTMQRLLAGASAGITACVLTYPLDFVRARLTIQSGPNALYGGIVDAFRQVYRQEGVKGFYHGLWPSVVGIAPYLGLDFAVYQGLKDLASQLGDAERTPGKGELFLCGAAAGTVGQIVAFPIDTIRRRMQVAGFGPATYHYSLSITRTMRQIVREEGVQGLYKGMVPNLAKAIPAVSVSFVTYEWLREWLGLGAL